MLKKASQGSILEVDPENYYYYCCYFSNKNQTRGAKSNVDAKGRQK